MNKAVKLKLERRAVVQRYSKQKYPHNNTVLESEATTGIWYFCEGRYHRLRKTKKYMINYAPDDKNGTDSRYYEVFVCSKAVIDGKLERGICLGFDDGVVDINVSFSYRVADLPLLVDGMPMKKPVLYETAVSSRIGDKIKDYIQENGMGDIMRDTLRSDIVSAQDKLYRDLIASHEMADIGIELVGLKMTVR